MRAVEFWRYYEEVRRRWWVVGLLTLIAVITVSAYLVVVPPGYRSTAKISVRVAPGANQVLVYPQSPSQTTYVTAQELARADVAQIVMSPTVLYRIANHYPDKVIPGEITARPIEATSMVDLSATAATPKTALELAQTVVAEFMTFYKDLNRADAAESRKFIKAQLTRAQQRVEAADQALADFKRRSGVASLTDQLTQAVNRVSTLQADRDNAEIQARATRARIVSAQRQLARLSPQHVQSETFVDNPVLVQMRNQLTQLEIQLNELTQVYTEAHPSVIAVRQEIAGLQAQLPQAIKQVVGQKVVSVNPLYQQLQTDILGQTEQYEAAVARRDALTAVVSRMESQLPVLTDAERDLTRLLREQRNAESNYLLLSTKLNEALIKEQEAGYAAASLQMVSAPALPKVPVNAQLPLKLGLGFLVGGMLGVGAALFLGYLDNGMRTSTDAERVLGEPVLGVIPTISPKVYRQLTSAPRPAWATAGIVVIILAVVAAIFLAVRTSFAEEVTILWQLARTAL